MFGSKNKNQQMPSSDNIGMIVGKDTVFKGDVNLKELIRVDGVFEGNIKTTNTLIVGETGNIKGSVKAQDATVAGTFNGDLTIGGKLELLDTARIFGEIKAGSLVTNEGAIFQGTCSMPGGEAIASFDPTKKKFGTEEKGKEKPSS